MSRRPALRRPICFHRQFAGLPGSPWHALCLLLALAGVALPAWAQVSHDFEQEAELSAWKVNAPQGALTLVRQPPEVYHGKGAARLSFNASYGSYFTLQLSDLKLAKAASVRFAIRASESTPLRVLLTEKDGAEYDSFVQVPPVTWVEVQIPLSEFQLAEGSEDKDKRLDPAQISGVTLADLSNLGGTAGTTYGRKSGPQLLWLDDFHLDAQEAPGRYRQERGHTIIRSVVDTAPAAPASSLVPWLALGRALLRARRDAPGARGRSVLQVEYGLTGYQLQGAVGGIAAQPRSDLSEIILRVGGTSAGLKVRLEEYDGSKYDAVANVTRDQPWQELKLPLKSFQLAKYSSDENSRLDPDQVRTLILVIDTEDALLDPTGKGSLLVDDIELRYGKP